MTTGKRKVAVVIGVGAAPALDYLGGALAGARDFYVWAKALGYEATLITDEPDRDTLKANPVTMSRLRAVLDEVLAAGKATIDRFVLYFAGHGLIREAEEGLWLLSDWKAELRAVAVEGLKRRLYRYGIKQIAIFSDSCRTLPPDVEVMDLTADAVLGSGPIRATARPAVDKFVAAQDGSPSYMVPGPTPEQDRCIFSAVLLEALWGTQAGAFSKYAQHKITSRSLASFLESEVPKVAAQYGVTLVPDVSPTFPEGEDVYFGDGVAPTPPVFAPWPPADSLIQSKAPVAPDAPRTRSIGERKQSYILNEFRAYKPRGGTRTELLEAQLWMTKNRPLVRQSSGLICAGLAVEAIWTPGHASAKFIELTEAWEIRSRGEHGSPLREAVPALVEFENGYFGATTVLPRFMGSIVADSEGIASLVYHSTWKSTFSASMAERVIVAMSRGGLRAEQVADLTMKLRQGKHAEPVLGVISAYLYDSVGNVNGIRNMAYYYAARGQSIPYDIALLGQLPARRQGEVLYAQVPPIEGGNPQTDLERRFAWSCAATPEIEGPVGGFWPMLRQGWPYLDELPDEGSTLILPALVDLIPHLRPSRFATLDREGGSKLAQLFGLNRWSRQMPSTNSDQPQGS